MCFIKHARRETAESLYARSAIGGTGGCEPSPVSGGVGLVSSHTYLALGTGHFLGQASRRKSRNHWAYPHEAIDRLMKLTIVTHTHIEVKKSQPDAQWPIERIDGIGYSGMRRARRHFVSEQVLTGPSFQHPS